MSDDPDRAWRRAQARRDDWILLGLCLGVIVIITVVLYFAGALRPSTR